MLETKELVLRQGQSEDWVDLYRNLWRHERVFRYMFNRASATEEAAQKRTAAYAEMHRSVPTEFFVCEKASGQVIGIAGLKALRPGVCTITDIALGPEFFGKGYGKQIVMALLDHAFCAMDADEVWYSCFQEHAISRKLALSCGFQYSHGEQAELMKDGKAVILDQFVKKRTSG